MFCHIALYAKYVNTGFGRGVELNDPQQALKATGTRISHITEADFKTFQKSYIQKLLTQAHKLTIDSLNKKHHVIIGQSIAKSISPNKKRPA